MKEIIEKFSQAHLRAEIIEDVRVFHADNNDIFAMDVISDKRGEKFRIHLGSATNIVEVVSVDPKMQQLILRVKEPRRKFAHRRYNRQTNKFEERVTFTKPTMITYLAGMDETHLFIAAMPNHSRVNSIREAHQILMPIEVSEARKQGLKVKRQGEWFFIPITSKDEVEITDLMKIEPIAKNFILDKLNWRSKSHTVQYRIGNFVKGNIWHPDHHVLHLNEWHKFIRNAENHATQGSKFID